MHNFQLTFAPLLPPGLLPTDPPSLDSTNTEEAYSGSVCTLCTMCKACARHVQTVQTVQTVHCAMIAMHYAPVTKGSTYCFQFGQIHKIQWTNPFYTSDSWFEYILQFGKIHLAIGKDTLCNKENT